MTSNTSTEPSRSPLERRTTSSTGFSSLSNRLSNVSTEAESSTAASKRNSIITSGLDGGVADVAAGEKGSLDVERPVKDGRGSHRSHRSRNSGGFLLSNAAFEAPVENAAESQPRQRHSPHEGKGKAPLRSAEKKHSKHRSNVNTSVGGSPLAANVVSAGTERARHNDVGKEPGTTGTHGGTLLRKLQQHHWM